MTTFHQTEKMALSRPRDTTISLSSGEKIDVWVNEDIFTSNGQVKRHQEFREVDDTHLLSLQWPADFKLTTVTEWTPEVTALSTERRREFAQTTVTELGYNQWQMLQKVAERCYRDFDAHLLELSFWKVKLGHRDGRSAQHAGNNRQKVTKFLANLLADTEYLFRDIMVQWEISFPPGMDTPVQETSTDVNQELSTSVSSDGPLRLFSCFSRRNSEEQQQEDVASLDEKQICLRILDEVCQIRHSLYTLELKVDKNHNEIHERLEALDFSRRPELLPLSDTHSEDASGPLMLEPANYVTRLRPQQERHRGEQASQAVQKGQQESAASSNSDTGKRPNLTDNPSDRPARNPSYPQLSRESGRTPQTTNHSKQEGRSNRDSSSENRSLSSESPRERSRQNPSRTQDPPQRGPGNLTLTAGYDNSAGRGRGMPSIKEHHGDSRMTNNHGSGYHRESSRVSSAERANRSQLNPSPHGSPQRSSPSAPSSTLPSSSRVQSSASRTQAKKAQISQHRQMPSPNASSGRPQASSGDETGTQEEEGHEKGAFTALGMDFTSSNSGHSKSGGREELTLFVSDTEANLVRESVEKAYLEDEKKAPKARSFDTMLCLDISESMKRGGAFEQMKRIVLQFIQDLEDNVVTFGVEENLGLVTFGGRANVVQNLTNDFSLIQDRIEQMKPGGKSPFVEALLVSMAAFVKKGGIVCVSGEWTVKPRIIFISDGLPTESSKNDDIDVPNNINNVRLSLSNLLVNFKKSSKFNKVHPVFFVPVGEHADKNYMKAMSTICDGVYVEPENIKGFCHYFRVQETIGKVLVCLRRKTEQLGPEKIEATIMALTPDLTDTERKEVFDTVQRELANPDRTRYLKPRPDDLDYVFEDTDKVNEGKRLPLGTRVIRGPDWSHKDQDGRGPGTVIHHDEIRSLHWVDWDSADFNCYKYSDKRGYEIWKTDVHPRLRVGNEPLEIGMTVKKGKDWKPADDLTEQGSGQGVIIRRSKSKGKVMVRWSNGVTQVCQWSPTGMQEVDYCPPEGHVDVDSQITKSKPSSQDQGHPSTTTFEGQGKWQWRDENNIWQDYDAKTNRQIESACKKNPRTCIIQRDGKQCRIIFRKMVEKIIDDGIESEVRRILQPT